MEREAVVTGVVAWRAVEREKVGAAEAGEVGVQEVGGCPGKAGVITVGLRGGVGGMEASEVEVKGVDILERASKVARKALVGELEGVSWEERGVAGLEVCPGANEEGREEGARVAYLVVTQVVGVKAGSREAMEEVKAGGEGERVGKVGLPQKTRQRRPSELRLYQ